MAHEYIPSQKLSLRSAGFDELWLQRLVQSDPSILGLGDLQATGREVRQSSGGRLDFLLFDPDADTMYEVEVMLGATDESHIIRTLEYWDVESRRWPTKEHRAVIVAEEITNRFFNVIWLLNRSIPVIAIKLDTLLVEGKVTISFTKVLDIYEAPEGREPVPSEASSRQAWEEYSNPQSLSVADRCLAAISTNGGVPRITYNSGHIAIGGNKKNFAWFTPRKRDEHCMVNVRVGEPNMDPILQKLQSAGLTAYRAGSGEIRIKVIAVDLDKNRSAIEEALKLGVGEGGGL